MRMLRVFVAHEALTQWRSMRFRGLAAVYVIAAAMPAIAVFFIAARTTRVMGPTAYNTMVLSMQPLITALFGGLLAVDALVRERDEGSFGVLSVAPISSAGYVIRRWLAVVAVCVPFTLLPTVIAAALSVHTRQQLPLLKFFAAGWLLYVLPALLVSSALAISLGTITGRTVLAVVFTAILFTIGMDTINSVLFYFRLDFDGPGDLFAGGEHSVRSLIWAIRGYGFTQMPSEAGFPLISESRLIASRAGIVGAFTILLLAVSAWYLRRTRRDLRPWQIPETHQLRTLLKTLNRVREEFAPDGGGGLWDRAALLIAAGLAALLMLHVVQRQSAFAALAADRFAAEKKSATAATNTAIVAESNRVEGKVRVNGSVQTRARITLRNTGNVPQSHLSFTLNALVRVTRASADRGRIRLTRAWERLDVDLDPPIAAGQTRTLELDLDGDPGEVDFALQYPGSFAVRWNRYKTAKESIYMSDLSRSTITPAVNEARMRLRFSDVAPVLRYTAWTMMHPDAGDAFTREVITPSGIVDVHLEHPFAIAVDSCGTLGMTASLFQSRCNSAPATYTIVGGPFARRAISSSATLVYIPSHEPLARVHESSLLLSVDRAVEAWPALTLPRHIIFVERPREGGEREWAYEYAPWRIVQNVGSSGAIFLVPESQFVQRKAIDPSFFAAGIISGTLSSKRRVVSEQASFFSAFYSSVAAARLGMRKGRAVESATGFPPDTEPLLTFRESFRVINRMSRVLLAMEHRVGADHFVEGVNDFVAAGPHAGTAKELIDAIGRRGKTDLSAMYRDYFEGSALPQLTLEEVKFRRAGSRWEVTGAVRNIATGEAVVPVALRTSSGSLWQTLRVESGARVPFTWTFDGTPHSVQLDPDKVSYRHAAVGTVENVEFRGEQ